MEKPRSRGIVKTTGFRHSIWGGKEHARKVRDNIQTLSNLYETTNCNQDYIYPNAFSHNPSINSD